MIINKYTSQPMHILQISALFCISQYTHGGFNKNNCMRKHFLPIIWQSATHSFIQILVKSFRIYKNVINSDHGMVVHARQAGLSILETADLLWNTEVSRMFIQCKKHQPSSDWQFWEWKCHTDDSRKRRMDRLIQGNKDSNNHSLSRKASHNIMLPHLGQENHIMVEPVLWSNMIYARKVFYCDVYTNVLLLYLVPLLLVKKMTQSPEVHPKEDITKKSNVYCY